MYTLKKFDRDSPPAGRTRYRCGLHGMQYGPGVEDPEGTAVLTPYFINGIILVVDAWIWFYNVHSSRGVCSIPINL